MAPWKKLFEAGQELGKMVSESVIRVHTQEKLISFSQLALNMATSLALQKVSYVKKGSVVAIDHYLLVELEVSGGFHISARVVPESILLQADTAVVTFNIPDGIDAKHRNAVFSFMAGVFDSMLGFGLEQVPGIMRTGTRLSYSRPLRQGTLVAALASIAARDGSVSIPIFVDQKQIIFDLREFQNEAIRSLDPSSISQYFRVPDTPE